MSGAESVANEREVKITRDQLSEGAKRELDALRQVLAGLAYIDRRVYDAGEAAE